MTSGSFNDILKLSTWTEIMLQAISLYLHSRMHEGTVSFNSRGFLGDPSQPYWHWFRTVNASLTLEVYLVWAEEGFTLVIDNQEGNNLLCKPVRSLTELISLESNLVRSL